MISEDACIDIIKRIHGKQLSMSKDELYREMLGRYDLDVIDSSIRWLELREYISILHSGVAFVNLETDFRLTEKGVQIAIRGTFPDEEKQTFRKELLEVRPGAYGIHLNLPELWRRLRRWFKTS